MLIKDIMTRTSIKFFENDCINDATTLVITNQLKGGLVYNRKDELCGIFTEFDLLAGFAGGKKYLSEMINTSFTYLQEMEEIKNIRADLYGLCPVKNTDGKVSGFLTKEQYLSAIAAIAQSERNHLDALFHSAHYGILAIDVNGRITSINPAAEKMARKTKQEAVGKFLTDVVVPGGLLQVVRTGEGHTEKYQVGNRKYITHRAPIFAGQQVIGAVGFFQDISEIEFISSELDSVKQIVNELDTILNNISDGICITDRDGNMIKSNQVFERHFDNNLSPDIMQKIIRQAVTRRRQHHVLEMNQIEDNSFMIKAIPIFNRQKRIERIVIHVKDMTEIDRLRKELEKTKSILEHMHQSGKKQPFVARSQEMTQLVAKVGQVAKVDVTVLLTGESGVGKEEVANLIQQASPRKDCPFIKVNCGAIPETLMESEIFGYEGGAFTGARKQGKTGLFEQAEKGTIFLDEIGEIPLQLQVKLLRVLQEMEITKVGAAKPTKIDVRVIAATNRDLFSMVKKGEFREDLFYRLNVIPISIPPLRNRVEDIPHLIDIYKEIFSAKYHKQLQFSAEAMQVLTYYNWPGNVRELVNIIERIYVTVNGTSIGEKDIRNVLGDIQTKEKAIVVNEILPLKLAVDELERELILKASHIEKSYRGIARVLEVNPSTIIRKVKKWEGGGQSGE
ncbi:sigma 54-interacting transcriptional regulator [Bacillaceae bacterium Marseille-Q3522]|nr:sigma 54-interacting transcriptional regulator [Bacillaceae bacterium Marseille-Q3522]